MGPEMMMMVVVVCFIAQVSSSEPGGHDMSQACQTIACFACPACYLLFNLRDQCLQHMASKKHYTHALGMIKGEF